jgi:hypothetical protein
VGWVAGDRGKIFKSTNGGDNWVEQNSNTLADLWSLYFVDANTGWVVGQNGSILKTEDGGTNWFQQNSPVSEFLFSLQFLNTNIGYTCGLNGTILKTTEGGADWQQQVSGTGQGLIDLHFLSPDTGYVVGWFGTILKTTNGGVGTNSLERIQDNILQSFKLDQNFPNPFNSTTKIKFSIQNSESIKLEIYNVSGQMIDVLINSNLSAGIYSIDWDASGNPSGIYYAILRNPIDQEQIKILHIK